MREGVSIGRKRIRRERREDEDEGGGEGIGLKLPWLICYVEVGRNPWTGGKLF